MLAIAVVLVVAVLHGSQASLWIGMTPEPNQPQNVSIFQLSSVGTPQTHLATVLLEEPGEHVSVDSFRCKPAGTFCLLSSTNGTDSWLYNITWASGKHIRTALPGVVIHNLHVDHTSGAAYTVALSPGSAVVTQVLLGVVTPLVDASEYFNINDTVYPGGTTQCSDDDYIWLHIVPMNLSSPGSILTVNMPARKVVALHSMTGQDTFNSMWASCNNALDVNNLGGSAVINGGSTIAYGTLSDAYAFSTVASIAIPHQTPALVPTGLLSQPPQLYDYFIALYPKGAQPGGPQVGGYLAFGDMKGSSTLKLVAIDYYLTGAAGVN